MENNYSTDIIARGLAIKALKSGGGAKAEIGWDGQSTPDVSKIPAGVQVTYHGTTYTGTLEASEETTKVIILVYNGGEAPNVYDEYHTVLNGSTYVWEAYGQKIDLSDYYTKTEIDSKYADVAYISPIEKQILTVPVAENVPEYIDTPVSPEWYAYNPDLMTIGGQTSASSVGTFTATFTLKDTINYCWADGTIEVKSVQWTVKSGIHIYGAEWAGTSDPSLTRTDDAALFADPVPYVNGATEYGSPFDNLMPWSGMQIVEDEEAGTLVRIPKFWFKITQNGDRIKLQIADGPAEGFSVSPAHQNRGDGYGERNYVYIGRYPSQNDGKSLSGVIEDSWLAQKINDTRTVYQQLGAEYWITDIALYRTIQMLYLVEFANWSSQTTIGLGCYYASIMNRPKYSSGYTDGMPYHTGTNANSRSDFNQRDVAHFGTQYRYIEGLWDIWNFICDGVYAKLVSNKNNVYLMTNPTSYASENGTLLFSTNNFAQKVPSKIEISDTINWAVKVIETNGSVTTYTCDRVTIGTPWGTYFSVGGGSGNYYGCGLFKFDALGASSSLYSRLMKLPNN